MIDQLLKDAVFERGEYEEAPESRGYQSALCYCGHRWHVGGCTDAYYLGSGKGYHRTRPCGCASPKLGEYQTVLEVDTHRQMRYSARMEKMNRGSHV